MTGLAMVVNLPQRMMPAGLAMIYLYPSDM